MANIRIVGLSRFLWRFHWTEACQCKNRVVTYSSQINRWKSAFPVAGEVKHPATAITSKAFPEASSDDSDTAETEKLKSFVRPETVAPILRVVSDMGISKEELDSALQVSPEMLKFAPYKWENFFSILISCGFSSLQCLKMVAMCPPLLGKPAEDVETSLDHWRGCNFSTNSLVSVLTKTPHLLCVRTSVLTQRIPVLQNLYSKSLMSILLMNSPTLLLEKWSSIEEKINYVKDTMGVHPKQVVHSSVFDHSLQFIKTRHLFLERAGLYIKPNLKSKVNKNPKLSMIVDTDDEEFATRVAGLSKEEYEVFSLLMQAEDEQESDESSDSDDDSYK